MEKTMAEEKSSEDFQRMIAGEVSSSPADSQDSRMQESLKILSEETLQLSEFLWQEEKLVKEVCALLKLVLKQLNISFNLPADVIPPSEKMQRIALNDEAHLILINDKNEVRSKALEDYPPQVIFNIVSFVIPEMSKSLTSYRKRISVRISFFERVNQELRNLRDMFTNRPRTLDGNNPIDDGVKKALQAQEKEPEK